jgi:hypothetical protein
VPLSPLCEGESRCSSTSTSGNAERRQNARSATPPELALVVGVASVARIVLRRLHYLRHLLPPIPEAPERRSGRRTPGRWDAGRPKHVRKAPRGGHFATASFSAKPNYGIQPSLINALDFLASEWAYKDMLITNCPGGGGQNGTVGPRPG